MLYSIHGSQGILLSRNLKDKIPKAPNEEYEEGKIFNSAKRVKAFIR